MQYANKKMFIRLQDFEMIMEEIKSCKNKQTGGTLYGFEDGWAITVNQISINENHAEYLDSEHINQLQTNAPTHQYLGEWFYHADFKGLMYGDYDKIMQKKSVAASKVQEFKSPIVFGFNIVDGQIIAVGTQFSVPLGLDIFVTSANGLEYMSDGFKIRKCTKEPSNVEASPKDKMFEKIKSWFSRK